MSKENNIQIRLPNSAESTFQERLNFIVFRYGSGTALAKSAGVSQSVLVKWAQGKSEPTRDRLVALAKAGGVSIGWLTSGVGPMKPEITNVIVREADSERLGQVDVDLLTLVLGEVEANLESAKLQLAPKKKARLVALLYLRLFSATVPARKIDRTELAQLIKLAS